MPNPDIILSSLTQFGYAALFVFNFFEGSLVVLLGAFLASQGYFKPLTVLIVILLSDTLGNILYYCLGRFIDSYKITSTNSLFSRIQSASEHVRKKPGKLLILSKYAYSLGFLMQVGAGIAKVPLGVFFFYNAIGNISKTLPLLFIGYFFGSAYKEVNSYIGKISIAVLFILVVCLVAYYVHKKNYFRKEIQNEL